MAGGSVHARDDWGRFGGRGLGGDRRRWGADRRGRRDRAVGQLCSQATLMDASVTTSSRRNGRSRVLLLGLIVAQVALFGVVALEWRHDSGGASAPLVRLEMGLPAGVPLTIESGFNAALRRAQGWSADAYLVSTGMQVDWPTNAAAANSSEIPGAGWVIYAFAAGKRGVGPEGKAATLSMLVDRMSGVVIDEQEMGWRWQPDQAPLLTTYPISSTVALFAAETTMGNAYRTACPE